MRDRPIKLQRPTPYRALALIVLLAAVALGLILLDRDGRLDGLRGQAEVVLNPALSGLSGLGRQVGTLSRGVGELGELRSRVNELEQENSRLKAENIKAQTLIQENTELRKQVRLEQERPWKLFGANVLAHSPDPGRHLLTLAAGSAQGIKPGMAVIAQDGSSPPTLIGVVEDVQPNSAGVVLINDFSSAVSARIYREGKPADGLLQGQTQPGAELQLLQVDRSTPLAAGDTVVTAGLTAVVAPELPNAAIPYDIPIGAIASTRAEGNSQIGLVRPFVDPDRIRYAWVLLNAGE